MSICNIPIAIGELWDKYTILSIKLDKINETDKLSFVNIEINLLKPYLETYKLDDNIFNELKKYNEQLWEIEDNLREKERKKEFDNDFIKLARSVYFTNDKRAKIKKKINTIFNSTICEVKSYKEY